MNQFGDLDFRLSVLLRAWTKEDAPPTYIMPLPLQLVHAAVRIAHAPTTTPMALIAAD
jgi:hypothetical protein